MKTAALLLLGLAAVSALPTDIISKLGNDLRYQYVAGPTGELHLVDHWLKPADISESSRFNPDAQNVYHLFTRQNPTVSQPMLVGNSVLLGMTNYDAQRRTVVLLHGWLDTAVGTLNAVIIPAYLAAEDVNIVVVDWSQGADTQNILAAIINTTPSGESVARFINWLNSVTGQSSQHYHVIGHSLGGHKCGIIGRNVNTRIDYITSLDPTFYGWLLNNDKLRRGDAQYSEVIHTNAGILGYLMTLGDTDFYPNGGVNQPGCGSPACDHDRGIHFFAESLVSGGFSANRCLTYIAAMDQNCFLSGSLNMGGRIPKIGSTGVWHMVTNASPPFSRG